ncbi:MAG: hypothetical protein HQL96_04395 [Magnetococcales bacterium]|nr:hypothetical protein [Magnetococcales bacterium]
MFTWMKKGFVWLIIVGISAVMLEVGAYFIHQHLLYQKRDWAEILANAADLYPGVNLDQVLADQHQTNANLEFDFYRHYRPKSSHPGKAMSTDAEGFRQTVQYLKPGDLPVIKVALLGGSTMWGIGAEADDQTLASHFGRLLNAADPQFNYRVKNLGVGGYQNTQELIILLERLAADPFDIYLFYDGVNEAIAGLSVLDRKLENHPLMVPHEKFKAWTPGTFTNWRVAIRKSFERWLNNLYFVKCITIIRERRQEHAQPERITALNEREIQQARRVTDWYAQNKRIIEALAREFHYLPLFLLQPTLFTKESLSAREKDSPQWSDQRHVLFERAVYEAFRQRFGKDDDFFDLSHAIRTPETVYLDDHHVAGSGNRLLAEIVMGAVGERIMARARVIRPRTGTP